MSVLLTGGAGFIGSHTAVEMIHAGYDVIIADDLSNASPNVIYRIETISGTRPKFYQIDASDKAAMTKLIGEAPNGIPNNLMPYITQVAIGQRDHLSVYGNDYPTPDGTGVRDYLHVVDLALGHVKAVDYALHHTGAEPINLGTGKGSSVLDVVHAFEKASGLTIPLEITARRPGDIATCFASAEKAKRLLGWEAKYNLDDMCAHSWNWQKNNPKGYDD